DEVGRAEARPHLLSLESQPLPMRAMEFFPVVLHFAFKLRIRAPSGVGLLPLEFLKALPASGIQRAILERRLNRTAWLGAVRAVAIPAACGERCNIGERRVECVRVHVPELQLAHARRVDDDEARRRDDELAVRRRVPPARPARIADRARELTRRADELVD